MYGMVTLSIIASFPRLYSFAKNKKISMAQFLLNNEIENQFHLPLFDQAFQQYHQMQQLIQQMNTGTVGTIFGEI
jgi:hypothetical protein